MGAPANEPKKLCVIQKNHIRGRTKQGTSYGLEKVKASSVNTATVNVLMISYDTTCCNAIMTLKTKCIAPSTTRGEKMTKNK